MDRWQTLKAFVEKWNERPISPGDGNTEEEVAAAESRLGVRLPEAVREFYKLVGNRKDLTTRYDRLTPLSKLEFDGDNLVIWEENQGVSTFCIKKDNFLEPDPLTELILDGVSATDNGEPYRFTEVALLEVATEIVFEGDFSGIWGEEWPDEAKPVPEKSLAEDGFEEFGDILACTTRGEILIAVRDAETMLRVADKWDHIEWTHI